MNSPLSIAEHLVTQIGLEVRDALNDDPVQAIPQHFGASVEFVPAETISRSCGIEGKYDPTRRHIELAPDTSPARLRFTLMHELGHHVAQHDLATAVVLGDRSLQFEEAVANAFAAEVLVPRALSDEVVEKAGLTAHAVVELITRTAASSWACCQRLGQYLPGNGYVLVGSGGTVEYAALVGDAHPLGRGAREDHRQLFSSAERHGRHHDSPVRIIQPSGVSTREYAGQAVGYTPGRFIAVLTDQAPPPWGGLTGKLDDRPKAADMECWACQRETRSWKRCLTCGGNICATSSCGWCACKTRPQVKTRFCTECFQERPLGDFDDSSSVCCEHR